MAWERIFKAYWYPLFCFLRREGQGASEAEETLQQFFVWMAEKQILTRADRQRGRFRTFLLVSLKQFVQRQRRRLRRAAGSVVGGNAAAMAERSVDHEVSRGLSPEAVYERTWALELLRTTMDALRCDFERAGECARFDTLRGFLTCDSEANYADAANALGLSPGAVRVAVHRLRQRFGELLRAKIAETVPYDGDIDDEILGLFRALGDP